MSKPLRPATQPYTAQLISKLLRGMDDAKLRAAQPADFQRHPAPVIERGAVIRELIDNERASRR